MIPDGAESRMLRLRLGEILLGMSRSSKPQAWMLFTAVDLLASVPEHDCKAAIPNLARLRLEAASRASTKSTFRSAASYADRGLALLEKEKMWTRDYKLAVKLSMLSAEMHLSYGDFAKSSDAADHVICHGRCLEDKLPCCKVQVEILGARMDTDGACRKTRQVLRLLGLRLPSRPTQLHVVMALLKTKWLLKGCTAGQLRTLPWMTDSTMIEAMRFLTTLSPNTRITGNQNIVLVVSLAMMQVTLRYGLSPSSPYGIAVYGVMNEIVTGDKREAFEFGSLALEFAERPEMSQSYCATAVVSFNFHHHLQKPLSECRKGFREGYKRGMEGGGACSVCWALSCHSSWLSYRALAL